MNWSDVLRPSLWIVLGIWIGALLFFGTVVAPAVLRTVPSPGAGELVRTVLFGLDWAGVALGGVAILLGLALRRGPLAMLVPALLVGACLISQLWIAPSIAAARPNDPLNKTRPEIALRFRSLHQISVGLYIGTLAGVFGLAYLHGRIEARGQRGASPSP